MTHLDAPIDDDWIPHLLVTALLCSKRRPPVLTTIRSTQPALRPDDMLMCLFDITALSLGIVSRRFWSARFGSSRFQPPSAQFKVAARSTKFAVFSELGWDIWGRQRCVCLSYTVEGTSRVLVFLRRGWLLGQMWLCLLRLAHPKHPKVAVQGKQQFWFIIYGHSHAPTRKTYADFKLVKMIQ